MSKTKVVTNVLVEEICTFVIILMFSFIMVYSFGYSIALEARSIECKNYGVVHFTQC